MEKIIKPVFWTSRAKSDLTKLLEFYSELFNTAKAKEIAFKIKQKTEILENPNADFTKIGTVDNEFLHLKRTYRKLFIHHCKITYREGKTKIFVVRVFDMRQNPNKNK